MIEIAASPPPSAEDQALVNALPLGFQLDAYRIDSLLGAGGFGVTYKAWDTLLETWVAIKEYFPLEWSYRDNDRLTVQPNDRGRNLGGDGRMSEYLWGMERFLDEARVLARVQHPFVVRVRRYFRAHGTAYIVMDYEEGKPLNEVLHDKETLRESEIRGLLEDVLPALQAVHVQGFLHRDIKPSNLYVRASDHRVILIDFGAARAAIGRYSNSVISLVTPGYSPPEQYAARDDHHGPWSDIYALGAVLYRCVTGDPPVEATERLLEDSLIPAAQIGAGRYSASLLQMIDQALAVRPEQRFSSVMKMQVALNAPVTAEIDEDDDTVILGPPTQSSEQLDEQTIVPIEPELTTPSGADRKPLQPADLASTTAPVIRQAVAEDESDGLRILPPLAGKAPARSGGRLLSASPMASKISTDHFKSARLSLVSLGVGLAAAVVAVAFWLWPTDPQPQQASSPAASLSQPTPATGSSAAKPTELSGTTVRETKPLDSAVSPPAAADSLPATPVAPAAGSGVAESSTAPAMPELPTAGTPTITESPAPAAPAGESAPAAQAPGHPQATTVSTESVPPATVPNAVSVPEAESSTVQTETPQAPTESTLGLPVPPVSPGLPAAAPALGIQSPAGRTNATRASPTGESLKPAAVVNEPVTPKASSTARRTEPGNRSAAKGSSTAASKANARSAGSSATRTRTARRRAAEKRSRPQASSNLPERPARRVQSAPAPAAPNPWEAPTSTGFNQK